MTINILLVASNYYSSRDVDTPWPPALTSAPDALPGGGRDGPLVARADTAPRQPAAPGASSVLARDDDVSRERRVV